MFLDLVYMLISALCALCAIVARDCGYDFFLVGLLFFISALFAIPSIKCLYEVIYKTMFEQVKKNIKGDKDNENDKL